MEKGIQTLDFDSQIAYVTIVMLRALFLSLEQRRREAPQTLGSLFRACCQEMWTCPSSAPCSVFCGWQWTGCVKLKSSASESSRS